MEDSVVVISMFPESRLFTVAVCWTRFFGGRERPKHVEKTEGFQFAGHFADIMLDVNKIDFSRRKYYLPGVLSFPGPTFLGHIEAAPTEHAQTLGVCFLGGIEVSQFVDEGENVRVWAG